jgi:hypothetical protein
MKTLAIIGGGIILAGMALILAGPWGPCGPGGITGFIGLSALPFGGLLLGIAVVALLSRPKKDKRSYWSG